MKNTVSMLMTVLFCVTISLISHSQSIDTTKFYILTNAVLGEKQAMTGVANATLGNSVRLRTTSDHPMQQWMIEPAPYGGYILYCREYGRNYALEVVNEGSNSKKISLGAAIKNSSGQVWKVNRNPDGSYRLVSLWQDKALDYVKTGEQANQLTLTEIESSVKSQTWRLVAIPKPKPAQPAVVYAAPVDTGIPEMDTSAVYKLTCQFRGNGFAIEAVNDENGNIKPMLREASSDPAQQWKFKFYNTDGGIYRLVNSAFTERSLDIVNDGKQNANLTLAASGNYSGQYWRVIKNVDGSYWFISYWQRGNAIDVVNAGNKDELIVAKSGRFTGQLWNLTKDYPKVNSVPLSPPLQPVEPTTSVAAPAVNNQLVTDQELRPSNFISSANGRYKLIQQEDGNLVIYEGDRPTWATGTNGRKTQRCVMQKDGNLVLYDIFKDAVWASNTHGNENAYVVLNDEGVLEIFNTDNQVIWRSQK